MVFRSRRARRSPSFVRLYQQCPDVRDLRSSGLSDVQVSRMMVEWAVQVYMEMEAKAGRPTVVDGWPFVGTDGEVLEALVNKIVEHPASEVGSLGSWSGLRYVAVAMPTHGVALQSRELYEHLVGGTALPSSMFPADLDEFGRRVGQALEGAVTRIVQRDQSFARITSHAFDHLAGGPPSSGPLAVALASQGFPGLGERVALDVERAWSGLCGAVAYGMCDGQPGAERPGAYLNEVPANREIIRSELAAAAREVPEILRVQVVYDALVGYDLSAPSDLGRIEGPTQAVRPPAPRAGRGATASAPADAAGTQRQEEPDRSKPREAPEARLAL